MQKILLVGLAFFSLSIAAVSQLEKNSHSISVTINETTDTYGILAKYDKSKTNKVQRLVDKSLENVEVDATMTFENNITVHVKARPGKLEVLFDKRKNTPEAYTQIKKIAADIIEAVK